jgi:hypothetical protein
VAAQRWVRLGRRPSNHDTPSPAVRRFPPGFTAPSNGAEISHEAYAEVASTEIQQWLDEDATQRTTVGNIRFVFTDLDRLPTQPCRRP